MMKIGKLVIRFHSPVTIEVEEKWMKDVKQALHEGRKLLAVKIYKENTGTGLKEAKDFVFDTLVPKYYREPKPRHYTMDDYKAFVRTSEPIEFNNKN
jgi:hypothetical protein